MNIVLSWLAVAGTAVVLVAVAVAWLEHRRRMASRRNDPAWFATEINMGALAGGVDLGLGLDHLHGQPANRLEPDAEEPEQTARQSVLVAALSRMARHKAEPDQRNAWADTQPLINAAPSVSAGASIGSTVE